MFVLNKLKNWTKSSVANDKFEKEIYQKFQDQFQGIKAKIDEYIKDSSYTDQRLLVDLNGKKVSLGYIDALKQATKNDRTITADKRAIRLANITQFYELKLKELEKKIIYIAITNADNTYLAYIKSSIEVLNMLLKEYSHLLAIQRSGITQIDGVNPGNKIKALKDQIEIRLAEIESRLAIEEMHRR